MSADEAEIENLLQNLKHNSMPLKATEMETTFGFDAFTDEERTVKETVESNEELDASNSAAEVKRHFIDRKIDFPRYKELMEQPNKKEYVRKMSPNWLTHHELCTSRTNKEDCENMLSTPKRPCMWKTECKVERKDPLYVWLKRWNEKKKREEKIRKAQEMEDKKKSKEEAALQKEREVRKG